jgi:hypothetical protein
MVNDSNRLFRERLFMRLHHRNPVTLHDHKYQPAALLIPVPHMRGPSHLLPERDTAVAVSTPSAIEPALNS